MEISSPPAVVPCGGSIESTFSGPPPCVHAAIVTNAAMERARPRTRFIVCSPPSEKKEATIAPDARTVNRSSRQVVGPRPRTSFHQRRESPELDRDGVGRALLDRPHSRGTRDL